MLPTQKVEYPPEPDYYPSEPTLPPMPPTYPDEPTAKRGGLFSLGIAGIVIVGIICILAVAAIVLFTRGKKNPVAAILQVNTPTATTLRATNTRPSPSLLATSLQPTSLQPTSLLPATAISAGGNSTRFYDDFADSSSGWWVGSEDRVEASYYQGNSYVIRLKDPNYYFVSNPPGAFSEPMRELVISVRGKAAAGDVGEFGVVCRYQDIDNFYLGGISGDRFYIGKKVDGEWIYLTDPSEQPLPDAQRDSEGYLNLGLSCIDSSIMLEVNGILAASVTDEELSTGKAGLYVWAGEQLGQDGYYFQAYFDDFSVSVP
jgi:hypothetical protein